LFNNQYQEGHFQRLWWAQDSAPAHQLIAVRERHSEIFADRVIALHLPIEWPPRSPNLTPCDYFLWGVRYTLSLRYPPQDINDLRQRIQNEANVLRENPELIRRVVLYMRQLQRTNLCELRNGGHVE
jgi:hypothetical protein